MPTTYAGTIEGFRGHYLSGLGYLIIDGKPIACENAPTVRALEGCFGGVIGDAHNVVESPSWIGQQVVYSVDDLGLLMGFTPVAEWTGPEIPEEGVVEPDPDLFSLLRESTCEFCKRTENTEGLCCDSEYQQDDNPCPWPIACTREPEHQPPHVACGTEHNVESWTDEQELPDETEDRQDQS